ncbi:protein FAM151B [Osmerus mordax]|uniref:protein FAM151B n=1 Tax=Osmerus mordax TaxID=8014 RepID=UPI003510458E
MLMRVLHILGITRLLHFRVIAAVLAVAVVLCLSWNFKLKTPTTFTADSMSDRTLEYFVSEGKMEELDAADVDWSHAANSRAKIAAALTGPAHMIEADVLMRGRDPREPIMAHPPETDSDITLHDWLKQVAASDKGIKLDFKSLQAVAPSMVLLQQVQLRGPVWINADILPGPGGQAPPLDPQAFLDALGSGSQDYVLSLGWTTGWVADTDNPGYSWEMVRRMEEVCGDLKQPITFPVRAALLPQSASQLHWLLQKSDRYSLTVWTGQTDVIQVNTLLTYRKKFEKSQIYYDLLDSQSSEFRALPGYS